MQTSIECDLVPSSLLTYYHFRIHDATLADISAIPLILTRSLQWCPLIDLFKLQYTSQKAIVIFLAFLAILILQAAVSMQLIFLAILACMHLLPHASGMIYATSSLHSSQRSQLPHSYVLCSIVKTVFTTVSPVHICFQFQSA